MKKWKEMSEKVMVAMLIGALTCGLCTTAFAEEETESSVETEMAETEGELPLEGEHYVFGINATFAPFEYVEGSDENGEEILAGLDIDLVEKFSEMLGFTYEFNDMDFSGLIGAISSGRCDVIVSGISINEERDEVVDASDAYFTPRIAILSYADEEYTDLESLSGHTGAVSFGTVYETILNDLEDVTVKSLDSTAVAFQELTNKTVDFMLVDATQAQSFIDDNPDMNLVRNIIPDEVRDAYEIAGYVVLVPEGETELLAYFDEAIDELEENGWLDELITTWCGEGYLD